MQTAGFVANQAQTAQVNQTIHLLITLAPAIAFALSLIPSLCYPLEQEKMDEISAELAQRRAEPSDDEA